MIHKIERNAKEAPDRIAYICRGERITYGELWRRATDMAQLLRKQGSGPVLLYGHKSADMVISIIACLLANRPYVPIDLSTPLTRVRHIAVITGADLLLRHAPIELDGLAVCTTEELHAYAEREPLAYQNDTAYVIFTSGSTGAPKGVPISLGNLANFVDWISALEPLCTYRACTVLNQASFSFDLSVADLYYALCNGHTLVGLDSRAQADYGELFDVIRKNEIHVCVMTPTFMKLCLMNKEFDEAHFPSLQCVYFCGEQLEKKLVEKLFAAFPAVSVINAYGPTEATSAVSGVKITEDDLATEELLPVGEVGNFATEIAVENGEIVLKGESVSGGYLGDVEGGFYRENGKNCYRTGDLGSIKNGKLYCQGRADTQIKYKGYRIELGDIESNLKSIPGVADAAAVTRVDVNGTVRSIKAFVVPSGEQPLGAIRAELQKRLPAYMIPAQIKEIDRLPMNENQKLDRKLLTTL